MVPVDPLPSSVTVEVGKLMVWLGPAFALTVAFTVKVIVVADPQGG